MNPDHQGGQEPQFQLFMKPGPLHRLDTFPTSFQSPGKIFLGWSTNVRAQRAQFGDGATVNFRRDETLYAVWHNPFRVVTFENLIQGQQKVIVETSDTPKELSPLAAMPSYMQRVGYHFVGWSTIPEGGGIGFQNTETYSFNKDLTLYAQWSKVSSRMNAQMVAVIGPFKPGSESIDSKLDSQLGALIVQLHKRQLHEIFLYGFSALSDSPNNSYELGVLRSEVIRRIITRSGISFDRVSISSEQPLGAPQLSSFRCVEVFAS